MSTIRQDMPGLIAGGSAIVWIAAIVSFCLALLVGAGVIAAAAVALAAIAVALAAIAVLGSSTGLVDTHSLKPLVLALSLALIAFAIIAFSNLGTSLAVSLLIVALALLVIYYYGLHLLPSIVVAFLVTLAIAAAYTHWAPVRLTLSQRVIRPHKIQDIQAKYTTSIGTLVLDLRKLRTPKGGRPRNVQVHAGIGRATVLVPPQVTITVQHAHVGVGRLILFDQSESGVDLDQTQLTRQGRPLKKCVKRRKGKCTKRQKNKIVRLNLQLSSSLGNIVVRRAAPS